jgi:amylosucrase
MRSTVEGRIYGDLRHLIRVRGSTPQLHAATPLDVVDAGDAALLVFRRDHPLGALISVSNVADEPRRLPRDRVPPVGVGPLVDLLDGTRYPVDAPIDVPARGVRWLVAATPRG